MSRLSSTYAYTRMEIEDPEEVQHRRAQFLIYKALARADSMRKPSCLNMKICKLKIKIGRRLKRLRKSMLLAISSSKCGLYKQLVNLLKTWKRLLRGREAVAATATASLPPLMII